LYIDIEALLDRQNRKLARKLEEEDHITKEPLAKQLA
jgi:hypothetical protein